MPIFKKVNKDFFKTWSHEMSYVLGFMYADGNIMVNKRDACFISLYSADRNIMLDILKALESEHKLSKRVSDTGHVYRFQIGSKEMFEDLGRLGLVPNKTLRLELPKMPKEYFADFLRGYFDGDGNVWAGKINKMRSKQTNVLYTVLTSGSVGFLKSLLFELKHFGIAGGSIYTPKGKNWGRLSFSTLDSLKIYEIMYNAQNTLFLGRKKRVFEKFIKLRL